MSGWRRLPASATAGSTRSPGRSAPASWPTPGSTCSTCCSSAIRRLPGPFRTEAGDVRAVPNRWQRRHGPFRAVQRWSSASINRAIDFFVNVLQFELVEDVPSLTNDGRPKRWVVVRPPARITGLLLARADGEHRARSSASNSPGASACSCASTTNVRPQSNRDARHRHDGQAQPSHQRSSADHTEDDLTNRAGALTVGWPARRAGARPRAASAR